MKKMINFLTLLILITILSIITIFITSCNSSSDDTIIGSIGGSGGSGGSGSGNVITLSLNNTGIPGTPVSQANNVNNNALSELANGLLDPNTNSLFILGNDYPSSGNLNVYLFQFDPGNNNFPNNPFTIDFSSGTNEQVGNLYIDQDNTHIYAMGRHNSGINNSDIFVAKIDKNTLNFDTNFQDANINTPNGVVLLDGGHSESTGGLLVDSTNNVLYVAGYNNQNEIIIFKLNTNNGYPVNSFGINGYTTIEVDNNTMDIATDILTDGTNLIIVGEQTNSTTMITNLMLFKVDPNTGNPINNSLIRINPPSGESFVAAALDAVILNNKVYLGSLLLDASSSALKNSALAVFDLNNNTASYFKFKDNNNNDIKIFITDVYPGTGNIIYLSGIDTTNNNNNAAFIKFDTSNNTGSYLSANSTAGSWWGNVFHSNVLYIFGRVGSSAPTSFTIVPINNP
jgi:hypothetical protein